MKRSSFLKRLLGISVAAVLGPYTKIISQEAVKKEKRQPTLLAYSSPNNSSRPIVIIVENTSGRDVRDVKVFDAHDSINEYFHSNGTLYNGNVLIKSDTPGKTYKDILYMMTLQPFHSDAMFISATNPIQLRQMFSIEKRDRNGDRIVIPFYPSHYITPYQDTDTAIAAMFDIVYTGDTKIVVSNLMKDERIEIRIYPTGSVQTARALIKSPELPIARQI